MLHSISRFNVSIICVFIGRLALIICSAFSAVEPLIRVRNQNVQASNGTRITLECEVGCSLRGRREGDDIGKQESDISIALQIDSR